MPTSLLSAACAVLDHDERLASEGTACDVRAERLARVRMFLRAWSLGRMTAEQAEGAIRELLLAS